MLDQRWQNYFLWLQERGLRLPTGICKHCGYVPVANARLTVCYPSRFSPQEDKVLRKYGSVLDKLQMLPLHRCKDNQLCAQQSHDLQQREHVLLFGAESSLILFNALPRFAKDRGHYRQYQGWGDTKFMLTFHPRDILRYPDNQLEWQRDFSEAINALPCL